MMYGHRTVDVIDRIIFALGEIAGNDLAAVIIFSDGRCVLNRPDHDGGAKNLSPQELAEELDLFKLR